MEITKGLLINWCSQDGKCKYSPAEQKKFGEIIDEYGLEKALHAAIASYVCTKGSSMIILENIQKNTLRELLESLPDISTLEMQEQEQYRALRSRFISRISQTA